MSDYPNGTATDLPLFNQGIASRDETFLSDVLPNVAERCQAVYDRIFAAGKRGVTLYELAIQMGVDQNVISGRVTELKAAEFVVHTKERRPTRTSTAAVIVAKEFLR